MIRKTKILLFTITSILSTGTWSAPARFNYQANFRRNPKIWGTYKLQNEKVKIERGKRSWLKTPPGRVGDVIISGGELIFVRENNNGQTTKIIVDKVPYKKVGKNSYKNKFVMDKEIINRLFAEDLMGLVPHRDLIEGKIEYDSLICTKNRGNLSCQLEGSIFANDI